jgi:hypothetical protein
MKFSPKKNGLLSFIGGIILTGCLSAQAGIVYSTAGAPVLDGTDISQLVGTTDPGGDLGHIWGNRPHQGQSFTTGSNAGGYTVSAASLRNLSTALTTGTWTVRLGTLSGSTFTPMFSDTFSGVGIAANDYVTWRFAPVNLNPNTQYAFDVYTPGSGFISANAADDVAYAGGSATSNGSAGTPNDGAVINRAFDRVFHVDLSLGMAPIVSGSSDGKISINFNGRNTTAVTGAAGAVSLGNWNNIGGNNQDLTGTFGLIDSSGANTDANLLMRVSNDWRTNGTTTPAGNAELMDGYLDNLSNAITQMRIQDLDASFTTYGYNVYVYYDTDSDGVFSITATDNNANSATGWAYEQLGGFPLSGPGGLIESTASDSAAANAAYDNAETSNYVKLAGLDGSSFDLAFANGSSAGDNRPRINGFQIVANIPEPGSFVLMSSGLILLMAMRRFKDN